MLGLQFLVRALEHSSTALEVFKGPKIYEQHTFEILHVLYIIPAIKYHACFTVLWRPMF